MLKEKHCVTCNSVFIPKGPAGKYCEACPTPSKTKEYARQATANHRRKLGYEVGVGSGRSSKNKGETHSQYKNGWTAYFALRHTLRELRNNKCERCEKDLENATKWQWVTHHRDHDRTNASMDNLELLCKRCHQIEHECWKAFEGATTISTESTLK